MALLTAVFERCCVWCRSLRIFMYLRTARKKGNRCRNLLKHANKNRKTWWSLKSVFGLRPFLVHHRPNLLKPAFLLFSRLLEGLSKAVLWMLADFCSGLTFRLFSSVVFYLLFTVFLRTHSTPRWDIPSYVSANTSISLSNYLILGIFRKTGTHWVCESLLVTKCLDMHYVFGM